MRSYLLSSFKTTFASAIGMFLLGNGVILASEPSKGIPCDRLMSISPLASVESKRPSECWTPLQISLANPVQLAPDTWNVSGLRLNVFWGDNIDLAGIDLGLANGLKGFGAGLQAGVCWNFVAADYYGIQACGLVNYTAGEVVGLQIAPIANRAGYSDRMCGLQAGSLNYAGDLYGAQVGIYNTNATAVGIQVGLVNFTKELRGLQIGLINIHEHGPVTFFPGLNFCF